MSLSHPDVHLALVTDPVDVGDSGERPRHVGHRPAGLLAPALDVQDLSWGRPSCAAMTSPILVLPGPVVAASHATTGENPAKQNPPRARPLAHQNTVATAAWKKGQNCLYDFEISVHVSIV